jgi:hypothetical protein
MYANFYYVNYSFGVESTAMPERNSREGLVEAGHRLIELGRRIADLSRHPGFEDVLHPRLTRAINELSEGAAALGDACEALRQVLEESAGGGT